MKMHKIKIGGRVFAACFNLNTLDALSDMAGPHEDGTPLDSNELMALWTQRYGILKTLLVMIREGERMEGRGLDVDEDWLRASMSPAEAMWMQHKVAAIMVEAMRMDTAADDDEEVDEVLEELKKKLRPAASQPEASAPGDLSQD